MTDVWGFTQEGRTYALVGWQHTQDDRGFPIFDGIQPAGRHERRWDASGLPAGVYLYRAALPHGTHQRTLIHLP